MKKTLAALGLIAAFALLAGCGGGGDSSTSSSDTFTADANKICQTTTDKGNALPKPQSAADIKPYLDKAVAITQDGISQLEGLTPPAEKKAGFDAWIATLKLEQAAFVKAQNASSPSQALVLVKAVKPISDKGDQEALDIGLTECGPQSGGGSSGGSSS